AAEVNDRWIRRIDEDELVVPALLVEEPSDLGRRVRVLLAGHGERGPGLTAIGRLEDVGEVVRAVRVVLTGERVDRGRQRRRRRDGDPTDRGRCGEPGGPGPTRTIVGRVPGLAARRERRAGGERPE